MRLRLYLRRTRDLAALGLVALCLWAATFHTPVGALARRAVAKLRGTPHEQRSLLSWFTGGEVSPGLPGSTLPVLPSASAWSSAGPLATAVWATWTVAPQPAQHPLRALASAQSTPPDALASPRQGPAIVALLLDGLTARLVHEDAVALAAFAGEEPTAFALAQVRAEGGPVHLDRLTRHLPPESLEHAALAGRALALATASVLGWPVDAGVRVSSPFGVRDHPVLGTRRMHSGVDLAVPIGTPVLAVGPGTVRRASEDAVNGRVLVIDHGRGVTSAYCHASLLLKGVGERVSPGERVALSGNTGRSTGPHLHYQLEVGGMPVDPLLFNAARLEQVHAL